MDMKYNISSDLIAANTDASTSFLFVLIPMILAEIFLSVLGNAILLILIGCFHKLITNLNIYLMSIGIFNCLLIFNKVTLLKLIIDGGAPLQPSQICYVNVAIQSLSRYGIMIAQFTISYDRFLMTKNPFILGGKRTRAWIVGGFIWIIAAMVAAIETMINIGDVNGDISTCFWPVLNKNLVIKAMLHISLFIMMLLVTLVTYYCHFRTMNVLKNNKMHHEMVSQIKRNSVWKILAEGAGEVLGRRRKSGGGGQGGFQSEATRTTLCLMYVFSIQAFFILLPIFYNMVRVLAITACLYTTGVNSDPSPVDLLATLTAMSLFAPVSTLFFLVVSRRYRKNVKKILHCIRNKILRKVCASRFPSRKYAYRLSFTSGSPIRVSSANVRESLSNAQESIAKISDERNASDNESCIVGIEIIAKVNLVRCDDQTEDPPAEGDKEESVFSMERESFEDEVDQMVSPTTHDTMELIKASINKEEIKPKKVFNAK